MDLDVVGLVAVLPQHRRVRRHIREALDRPAQIERFIRRGKLERDGAERGGLIGQVSRIVAEGVGAHPLLPDAAEIDIGDRHLGVGREALGFGEQIAQFEDAGLAVPGEVGRRLAGAGRRIGIGGDAAGRLRRAQQAAHLRFADRDVAGRQVEQDFGPGERRIGARRMRHPQILADLDMERERRVSPSGEQQISAEGRFVSGYFDRLTDDVLAGGELPPLVKFPVIRQIDLGHDAEQLSAMDDDAAIVEVSAVTQRRPDGKDREEVATGGDQSIELPLHFVEQRVLEQQIIDGIGGNSQLREHHQGDAGLVARSEEIQDIVGVLPRIGDCDMRNAGSEADEFVAVR